MCKGEFAPLRQWLIDEVLPQVVDGRRMKQSLYEELRARQIEPPTSAQIKRLLNSAQRQFEVQLCNAIMQQWKRKYLLLNNEALVLPVSRVCLWQG